MPAPVVDLRPGASVGIIAYGTTDAPMREARDMLLADGLDTSYLRIRALPLNGAVKEFIAAHDRVYVVEQNRDAQMAQLIQVHCGDVMHKMSSILHYDGLPVDARSIVDGVLAGEKVEAS